MGSPARTAGDKGIELVEGRAAPSGRPPVRSVLRFQEKGGKSREIPVRHDLKGYIRSYLDAAVIGGDAKESPLFRASNGRTKTLTAAPLTSKRVCELVKRRLKDAGLPERLSPHSFRVAAITDLLIQGVPLEDVQYLPGMRSHGSPASMIVGRSG